MLTVNLKKIAVSVVLLVALSFVALYFWGKYQLETVVASDDDIASFVEHTAVTPDYVAGSREPCIDQNPNKNAYFGALHIHTAVSGDAAGLGTTTSPADAYEFARGQSLEMRLRHDAADKSVPVMALDRPLDFAAVTDHAWGSAEPYICLNPGAKGYESTVCRVFRRDITLPIDDPVIKSIFGMMPMMVFKARSKRICGDGAIDCLEATAEVWEQTQQAAEAAYDRSSDCRFTTFVGYEYSLNQEGSNLHRNVIFANGTVPPSPLTAAEAKTPELLWSWLERNCNDAGVGCDALTIPHNSNWSSGRMFFPYTLSGYSREEQKRLAILRNKMEPLAEIIQVKGDSECRNGLSRVFGQPDEYCDFEKLRLPEAEVEDCMDSFGSGGMLQRGCVSRWSFVRYGLIEGLREEKQLGVNSLKLGIVAATDNHNGLGGAVSESNWLGSAGTNFDPRNRLREPFEIPTMARADATRFNPGGITGVWAEKNNREALFGAMQRRETFGTSGPRISPRFFGGWHYDSKICDSPGLLTEAYANGVPMGGDLPEPVSKDETPAFLVTATMDSGGDATPLQKIQIIKGWTDDDGNMQQKVIDVAGDASSTATVDTLTCERSGGGHASLCGVWRDDEFDAGQSAVYYSRVMEVPTCRWTTHDCNRFSEAERPNICSSLSVPETIQERAWTSPIWYSAPGASEQAGSGRKTGAGQ
ncbi:MAG: DUF3604 domain-containing protein [Halieaceae bacterium]|nr:DUF3604 domain-containing protein [Halieaceae bacterium]